MHQTCGGCSECTGACAGRYQRSGLWNRARECTRKTVSRPRGKAQSGGGSGRERGLLDGFRNSAEGKVMRHFLAAVQFLTIVPVSSSVTPAQAVFFFPIVGAILGVAAGGIRSIP